MIEYGKSGPGKRKKKLQETRELMSVSETTPHNQNQASMADGASHHDLTPPVSLSKQNTKDSHSKIKKRKTGESKMKLSQISEKPLDPTSHSQLVAYDSPKQPRSGHQRAMADDSYDSAKAKTPLGDRAEEVRANLNPAFPSFWKSMVRSNVTHGFWLHLPMRFCKLHMPKNDSMFLLENEKQEEYKVNYIAQRTALSGGWKAFSDANGLLENDVIVFHLIAPLKFKVYIVRANSFLNLDIEAQPLNSVPLDFEHDPMKDQTEKFIENFERPRTMKPLQTNTDNKSLMVLDTSNGNLENIPSSEPVDDFRKVKSIDEFIILVNGLAIDSELSSDHRAKYYELCSSQNTFLHEDLLKSINSKLAAEIITQTINIADAIRCSNISTSQADYEVWDKTLKGFELLGMNVGFLRGRLGKLMKLVLESEECKEVKRLREVSVEQARAKEEIRVLKSKLLSLDGSLRRFNAELEALKAKTAKHESMFQQEVNAPW